jgi:hypothetical protein
MHAEIDSILEQLARAQSAGDQYNIQSRLPTDPRSLAQGHPWYPFNNGLRAARVRRDPATINAARNALEHALLELSNAANRLRGSAYPRSGRVTPILPNDRRVGAFIAASVAEGRDRRTAFRSRRQTSTPELARLAPTGAEPLHGGPGREPRRCPPRMRGRTRYRRF